MTLILTDKVAVLGKDQALKSKIASLIAEQNDQFRVAQINADVALSILSKGIIGKVFATRGIHTKGEEFLQAAFKSVSNFDCFDEANDPYAERDFGSVTVEGQQVLWKIDYYDQSYEYGSKQPENPKVTRRVLTIMTAQEY